MNISWFIFHVLPRASVSMLDNSWDLISILLTAIFLISDVDITLASWPSSPSETPDTKTYNQNWVLRNSHLTGKHRIFSKLAESTDHCKLANVGHTAANCHLAKRIHFEKNLYNTFNCRSFVLKPFSLVCLFDYWNWNSTHLQCVN